MKKISMILILVALTATVFSQTKPFAGFLYDIEDNPYIVNTTNARKAFGLRDSTYNIRLIRFNVEVGGIQVLYNKTDNKVETEAFLKVGVGLSYSFYKVTSGNPYNYLSVNAFVFLPAVDADQSISIAATVSAFNIFGTNLSPAIGLNFEPSNIGSDYFPVGPLINLKYNF